MKEVLTILFYSKVRLPEVVTIIIWDHTAGMHRIGRPAPNSFKSQGKSMNVNTYSVCLNILSYKWRFKKKFLLLLRQVYFHNDLGARILRLLKLWDRMGQCSLVSICTPLIICPCLPFRPWNVCNSGSCLWRTVWDLLKALEVGLGLLGQGILASGV